MVDEHSERCGDEWEDKPCAICRGEPLDPGFLLRLERAVADAGNGQVMTAEEAIEWLRAL